MMESEVVRRGLVSQQVVENMVTLENGSQP